MVSKENGYTCFQMGLEQTKNSPHIKAETTDVDENNLNASWIQSWVENQGERRTLQVIVDVRGF